MKKLVKIFVVAAFALGLGVTAQAQTRNANITASATVRDELAVTADGNLAFGVVMQGAAKRLDAAGSVTTTDASASITGATTGRFIVNAGAGSSITLRLDVPANLTGPSSATMPIYFNKGLDPDVDGGTADVNVGYGAAGSSITMLNVNANNSITFPTQTVGTKNGTYVYVGGTVIPAANQTNGAYTGTITLTATYN